MGAHGEQRRADLTLELWGSCEQPMWALGIELGSSLRALLLITEPSFQSPKGGSYVIRTIWALGGLTDRETEAGVCSPGRWLISLAPVESAGFALRGENTHLAQVMGPPSHPNAGFSFQRLRSQWQDLEFRAAAGAAWIPPWFSPRFLTNL